MTQHTPTPYAVMRLEQSFKDGIKTVATVYQVGTDIVIARCGSVENAAFIVRACNAHEELVAILAPFIEIWSKGGTDYAERMTKYWGYDNLNKARDAIAKAEGK